MIPLPLPCLLLRMTDENYNKVEEKMVSIKINEYSNKS